MEIKQLVDKWESSKLILFVFWGHTVVRSWGSIPLASVGGPFWEENVFLGESLEGLVYDDVL